ncbi:hypothetical protein QBC39DRAFT_56432 [Podospora conica]|nr:hypothetical protein QBC39DRAFT_56432 [Schizothecium conicum]
MFRGPTMEMNSRIEMSDEILLSSAIMTLPSCCNVQAYLHQCTSQTLPPKSLKHLVSPQHLSTRVAPAKPCDACPDITTKQKTGDVWTLDSILPKSQPLGRQSDNRRCRASELRPPSSRAQAPPKNGRESLSLAVMPCAGTRNGTCGVAVADDHSKTIDGIMMEASPWIGDSGRANKGQQANRRAIRYGSKFQRRAAPPSCRAFGPRGPTVWCQRVCSRTEWISSAGGGDR